MRRPQVLRVCLLYATVLARPAAAQKAAVAPFSAETEDVELYAWSQEELDRARPEIVYAAERFRALFGTAPPRVAVVVFDTRDRMVGFDLRRFARRGLRSLPWLPPPRGDVPGPGLGLRGLEPLSHEAGHVYLMAYADGVLGLSAPMSEEGAAAHYGHPALPDWFDEAVATLCERPEIQASRRARLAREIDARIPLAELLVMEHPVAASLHGLIEQARSQARAEGRQASVVQLRMPAASMEGAALFYAEALTLGEFLVERGGPGFLARVADGLLEGRSLEAIVGEAGILPADLAVIERAWLEWVEAEGASREPAGRGSAGERDQSGSLVRTTR